MSGRGRGRGRGRGAVPPSVASAEASYSSTSSPTTYSNSSPSVSVNSLLQNNSHQAVFRNEPGQKFPNILLPEVPNLENFSAKEIKAVGYSNQLDKLMRESVFYRPLKHDQSKIDRYSDKYLQKSLITADKRKDHRFNAIQTDVSFYPEEVQMVHTSDKKPSLNDSASSKRHVSFKDTLSKLDAIARKAEESSNVLGENESEKGAEDEDLDKDEDKLDEDLDGEEAVEDEDDFEDDTDYNLSYFDNGEDYGGAGGDYDEGNEEAVF